MSPAETLRAAATLIRETASHALGTDRPWRYAPGVPSDSVRTEAGSEIAYGDDIGSLRWIALMSPAVAEPPLAAWLETCAQQAEAAERTARQWAPSRLEDPDGLLDWTDEPDSVRHALTFARSILGRQS